MESKNQEVVGQFNGIAAEVRKKTEAVKATRAYQMEMLRERISSTEKAVKKLEKRIHGLAGGKGKSADLAPHERMEIRKRLRFSLHHKQFYLEENGYESQEAWKKIWEEARSDSFFFLGSGDEKGDSDRIPAREVTNKWLGAIGVDLNPVEVSVAGFRGRAEPRGLDPL